MLIYVDDLAVEWVSAGGVVVCAKKSTQSCAKDLTNQNTACDTHSCAPGAQEDESCETCSELLGSSKPTPK